MPHREVVQCTLLGVTLICITISPVVCLEDFQVLYGPTKCEGQLFTEAETSKKPAISAPSAASTDTFTVLMWDPDAPSPSNPLCKSWLHWIYVDAVGKHLTGGTDAEAYAGPTPPEGVHTYHVTLYKQMESMAAVQPPSERCHFDPTAFANEHGLQQVSDVTFKVAAATA